MSAVRAADLLAEYRLWARAQEAKDRRRAADRFLDKWSKARGAVRVWAAIRLSFAL